MAEQTFSYSIENDKIFRDKIAEAYSFTSDLRVPFGLISADFYKSQQAIAQLNGPGKYEPFQGSKVGTTGKTRYQLRKIEKYGKDYPLLVASGALMNSVLGPRNKGSINIISPLNLIIGTSIAYGIYHQSDSPRKKLPQRKFLFIGPEAPRYAEGDQVGRLKRWVTILQDHIDKQLKRAARNG